MKKISVLSLFLLLACAGTQAPRPDTEEVNPALMPDDLQVLVDDPEYNGHCAWTLAVENKLMKVNNDYKLVLDGRVFYFDSEAHKADFTKKKKKYLQLSELNWQERKTVQEVESTPELDL